MASSTVKGAEYGSVVPFLGTSIGAALGASGIFGNKGDKNNVAGKEAAWVDPALPAFSGSNVVAPTDGETPLASLPTYGGAGGSLQAAEYYAGQDFAAMFGRNPTASELAALAPSYLSGDANIANQTAGRAQVSAYYNSVANNPTNIAAAQQAAGLAKYQAGQSGYDATTNAAFQAATGQAATPDELSHFGALLATGQIDAYGLSQLAGQTQQAQQYQTQQYQNTLSNNLQQTQGNYFQNYINPSILSQTAAAGRDPNSSGVQQAEVQAGKQQNYDLQNYLANFGASQYGQSAQNQQGVYNQYLNQQYGLTNAGISQTLAGNQNLANQNQNMANQSYQQQAYLNYINNYGKNGSGALNGALGGASKGAALGSTFGPYGTAIGAVGGGLAGYFSGGGNF
jgi:hypothetical protein